MQFMTMLTISLLAGFACGGLVWVTWSVAEVISAKKKTAAAPATPAPDNDQKPAKNGKA
ncbi:MAG: hypothetical protein IT364_00495 [Candidatus Hydrogenedentes bacterium]|nr:hypothetical protein [Candidatus Hydrogenedentota bacterium]